MVRIAEVPPAVTIPIRPVTEVRARLAIPFPAKVMASLLIPDASMIAIATH